jgi:hypothetical protein
MKHAAARRTLAALVLVGITADALATDCEEVVRAGPTAGDQVPSESVYLLDGDRRFVSATYRQLTDDGTMATYRVEDGYLIAKKLEGEQRREQRLALEPDAVVTGPHYVTDFFVLEPLALDRREKRTQPAYTFGFEHWRISKMELVSKRESDKTARDETGEKLRAVVYRCHIKTSDKVYKTRSWLGDDGMSVRITIDAPLGSVNIRLAKP